MDNLIKSFSGIFKADSADRKNIFSKLFNVFSSQNWNRRDYFYGTVYKCIDVIATSVSLLNYNLEQKKINSDDIILRNEHPAFQLLRRPNKFQTGVDLMYLLSSYIDSHGIGWLYTVKSMAGGDPIELWTLDPSRMRIVKDEKNFIGGYVYRNADSKDVPFEVDDIIPIMRPNPFDIYQGVSTIEMAKREIEGDLNAITWNSNFFKNGAVPSGVLTTEKEISKESFDRIKQEWHSKYEGVGNAHKTAILESGLTYQQISPRQKDMDYIEQRKLSRDQILSMFGVPKSIIGISEDVNRANAESAEYQFAKYTVAPRTDLIFEKLNISYLPKFKNSQNLSLVFENPVPDDKEFTLKRQQVGTDKWITRNEARALDHLQPIEGGDVLPEPSYPTNAPVQMGLKNKGVVQKYTTRYTYYSKKRKTYLDEKEAVYKGKLESDIKIFIRDIKKRGFKDVTKTALNAYHKGMTGISLKGLVDDIYAELIPKSSFSKLIAVLQIKYGTDALVTGATLATDAFSLAQFDVKSSRAIAKLEERAQNLGNTAEDSLQKRVYQIISGNLNQDIVDPEKIKEDIMNELNLEAEWRAERIARTELVRAFNDGSRESYINSDVVSQLKWITAGDDRVDDECSNLDTVLFQN